MDKGELLSRGMITGWAVRSRSRNFAYVSDVSTSYGTRLADQQGGHADRFPRECHKLYFVCGTALVDVDNRSNIACLQPFIGQVLSKHHAIVFVNHAVPP